MGGLMEAGGKRENKRWRKRGWRPWKKEKTGILKYSWGKKVPSSSAVILNAVQMVNIVPTPCQYRSEGSGVPTISLISKRVIHEFMIVATVRNFARSNTLFLFIRICFMYKNIQIEICEI